MRVNGERPPPAGVLIDPQADVVTVDGHVVKPPAKHRYIVLNKPLGVITTAKDGSKFSLIVRVTDCYRKINGRWLITQEHVSVPVDLESGKPDLLSKP